MPIVAEQQTPVFAARLSGVDLREPLAPPQVAAIVDAMNRYAVCYVQHPEPLTNEQHIAFSANLGPMEKTPIIKVGGAGKVRIPHVEIVDISNLDDNGNVRSADDRTMLFKRANEMWHVDVSFAPNRATYSCLSAHVIPDAGGDTEFADMRAAYDALPDAMKQKLEGLVAEHSVWHSREKAGFPPATEAELAGRPPAQHPVVHVHPKSGRKSLYVASHASHIVGWPVDEGRALLRELTEFATQPKFVYVHRWTRGDVIVWDNFAVMHRATKFDDTRVPRDMRRTTMRERATDAAISA